MSLVVNVIDNCPTFRFAEIVHRFNSLLLNHLTVKRFDLYLGQFWNRLEHLAKVIDGSAGQKENNNLLILVIGNIIDKLLI